MSVLYHRRYPSTLILMITCMHAWENTHFPNTLRELIDSTGAQDQESMIKFNTLIGASRRNTLNDDQDCMLHFYETLPKLYTISVGPSSFLQEPLLHDAILYHKLVSVSETTSIEGFNINFAVTYM